MCVVVACRCGCLIVLFVVLFLVSVVVHCLLLWLFGMRWLLLAFAVVACRYLFGSLLYVVFVVCCRL